MGGSAFARAFALDGRELVIERRPYPEADLVLDAPDRFMLLDWISFGENADPDVVVGGSVVAYLFDQTPSTPPAPTDPAAAPVRGGAELANTGAAASDRTSLALVLLVAGCACVVVSRRGSGRRNL